MTSPGEDGTYKLEVQNGLIRSVFTDGTVMYVAYKVNEDSLNLTIDGDEIELNKFTQEYLEEVAKNKEEEKKAEEARLAEEAAKRIVLDVQVDDFYSAENYLFVDVSVTNDMSKEVMFSNSQAFLLTEDGVEIGLNDADNSFTKVQPGDTQRACLGYTLESDADWANASKAKYLI